MAISRIAQYGPAAVASGNLSISWTTTPVAGNTIVLNVVSTTGQTLPVSISGWSTIFTNGAGAGFLSAQYSYTASGTESGVLTVMSVSVPSIAWMTEYHSDQGGKAVSVVAGSYGVDSDDSATGIQTTSVTSLSSIANDWIEAGAIWTSTTPSTPTAPVAASGRAVTQTGATLGVIQNRASTTWLANYRYNLSDVSVATGATAGVKYVSNTAVANLQGITQFAVLRELSANTPPISSASIPTSVASATTYGATDSSTVTTGGATISSRTWRIVSGGGSLSSTTAATITVTAPTGPTTQVIGIIATDSNGLAGNETTYSVTVSGGLTANAGTDQIVDSLTMVTLQGTGNGTSWIWRRISGATVALSSLSVQNPTFTAPATVAGDTIVFGLKVGNGATTSAEDTVSVTVLPQTEWVVQNGSWIGSSTTII
jgi:hypothetical protein